MGSGCATTKHISDVIITNDDFQATLTSIMWGRNIYTNLGRFLQFQVTVNFSCFLIIFFGAMRMRTSPISAVQLLWINLIMDTLAAFALATEPPHKDVIESAPYKNSKVFTKTMWGQIVFMSLYNVIVILILLLSNTALGLDYDFKSDPEMSNDKNCGEAHNEDCSANKHKHMTYIFNTFVFLQLFNQISCRKIGEGSINIFDQILKNKYFLLVITGEFAVQIGSTYFSIPRHFTKQTELSKSEYGGLLAIGASALLVNFLIKKLIPNKVIDKVHGWVSKFIDEDSDNADNNKILNAFNTLSEMKIDDNQETKAQKNGDYEKL